MVATVLDVNQAAAVLAIGTANPANCVLQEEFPDWYFRVTRRDHLVKLKAKMKRICTFMSITTYKVTIEYVQLFCQSTKFPG
jgi:hypothetical protein